MSYNILADKYVSISWQLLLDFLAYNYSSNSSTWVQAALLHCSVDVDTLCKLVPSTGRLLLPLFMGVSSSATAVAATAAHGSVCVLLVSSSWATC
jgi:hypothetical protein